MPTDSELRSWMQEDTGADRMPRAVDLAVVIRRSRRHRLSRQVAVGATTTLAAASITVAGVAGLQGAQSGGVPQEQSAENPATTDGPALTEPSVGADDQNDESVIARAPDFRINLCGGQVAEPAPSATGLVLTARFPSAAPIGAEPVDGTIVMTNSGAMRVAGSTSATPAVTFSQGGIVLWHSSGPVTSQAKLFDLEPGESIEYRSSFVPVTCSPGDDAADSIPADLPPVAGGIYDVSAVIDVTLADPPVGTSTPDLVSGPPTQVSVG